MEDIFDGRFCLITGASSGLGEEFARQLAARRSDLILTARSKDKLEALAASLSVEHGVRVEVIALDLGEPGGAARLVGEVTRRGLAVEHLISNAGFGIWGPLLRADATRQAEMVRLNCEAVVSLTGALLPAMVERGRGGIVHLASIAGYQPTPYMATYGASKAFVLSYSVAVAEEVRGRGVRVMALCPGPVPTGFQRVAGAGIARSQRAATLSAAEAVRRAIADYVGGRTVSVPGFLNKVSLLGSKLAPRWLVVWAVARMMRAKARAQWA